LRESEIIDLSRFKGKVCLVFFKGFEDNSGVDLRINFVKICVEFE